MAIQFPIRITTEFEPAGAQQASESLEKVGKDAEHSEINLRQLHTALSKLGEVPGELGELLHLLEGGVLVGGIAAVGIALEKLNEIIKETAERAAKAAEAAVELKLRFEEVTFHAGLEAAAAVAKFNETLEESARKQDAATVAMSRAILVIEQNTKATENLIDAKLKLFQAELDQAQARGQITTEEATRAGREAERQARAAKDAAEDTEKEGQVNARVTRGKIAQGEIAADQTSLASLRATAQSQAANVGAQEAEIKSRAQELADARKAVADAAAWSNDRSAMSEFALAHGGLANPNAGIRAASQEAKERQQDAEARLNAAKENLETAEKHGAALKQELEGTNRKVSQLENEIIARTELTKKLAEEAMEIEEDLKTRRANRAQVESTNDRTQTVADRTSREGRIKSGTASPGDVAVEAGYTTSFGDLGGVVRDMEQRAGLLTRGARSGDAQSVARLAACRT